MQRWKDFERCCMVPAFRELRAGRVYASTRKLACCQTCAHAELSAEHASYVFYHVQDKEHCLEAGPSQPLCLYLGYDFEDAATEARALAILKKHLDVEWDGDHRTRICVRPKAPCAQ